VDEREYREGTVNIPRLDGGVNVFDAPDTIGESQLQRGSFNYECERDGVIVRRPGNIRYGLPFWNGVTPYVEPGYDGEEQVQ